MTRRPSPFYEDIRTFARLVGGKVSPPSTREPKAYIVTGKNDFKLSLKSYVPGLKDFLKDEEEEGWTTSLEPLPTKDSPWLIAKSSGSKKEAVGWFMRLMWLIGEFPTGKSEEVDLSRLSLKDFVFFSQNKPRALVDEGSRLIYATWWDANALGSIKFEYERIAKTRSGVPFKFIAVPMIEEDA